MNSNNFTCSLETRTNKKGETYEALVIKLTDNLEKLVFLTPAEKELLKLKKSNNEPLNFPNI